MPNIHPIGVIAAVVGSASTTLLIVQPEHDLARSAAAIGVVLAALTALYLLLDGRMSRIERLQERNVAVEHKVLTTLQDERTARYN